MTGRYTGSGESQLQRDLDMFSGHGDLDAAGFEAIVEETLRVTLTKDFWDFSVPQMLVTSSTALSPVYQCYLAALNVLDADMFMLRSKVREWMDPALPAVKGTEGHHLFPRAYQERVLGFSDTKRVNQIANFAPTDWATNIAISDDAPAAYWPRLVHERGSDAAWMTRQHYWHALPESWETMPYDEFLTERRRLISKVVRDGFNEIGGGHTRPFSDITTVEDEPAHLSLSALVQEGFLQAGDLLDPVDPDWVVDAVVSDDGTVLIDGTHEFDSLDDAARFLGVTNISGFEFWALEVDGGLAGLEDVVREGR